MPLKLNRLKCYVHFIGSARSGHTLVAQILNSHKDVIISNEAKDYKFFRSGGNVVGLFDKIYQNSVDFAKGGSVWPKKEGYHTNYAINEWQGKTIDPVVIGDKFAPTVGKMCKSIDAFKSWVGYPVKLIHVTRNKPEQIISMNMMNGRSGVENSIKRDRQVNMARAMVKRYEGIEISLEKLRRCPNKIINQLCAFLKIDCDIDWMNICIGIIK